MFRFDWRKRRALTVTTVADDLSALDDLGRYLHQKVSFRVVPVLEGAFANLAASDAVVFYPDSFAPRSVQLFLRRLIGHATLSLVIIVTEHPERFDPLNRSHATANKFIVFSRPAWPWEILAALRAGLPGLHPEGGGPC